jgi:hypothetical protein
MQIHSKFNLSYHVRLFSCFIQLGSSVEEGTIRTPLLIIGVEGFGTDVLQNIIKVDKWDEIGCLLLPEQSLRGSTLEKGMRKGICSIWRTSGKKMSAPGGGGESEQHIILVNASRNVPHHRANAWASVLLNKIAAERLYNRSSLFPFFILL